MVVAVGGTEVKGGLGVRGCVWGGHGCGSPMEVEPLALLLFLLLRLSMRLSVAVRLARSTAAGDSRYTRSLCDWLIPGSLRW